MEEEDKPHMIYDEEEVEAFIRPRVGMPGYGSEEDEELASGDEWAWDDEEEAGSFEQCEPLFADGIQPSPTAAMALDEQEAGFSLKQLRKDLSTSPPSLSLAPEGLTGAVELDFYDTVRLINFVRTQVAEGKGLDGQEYSSRAELCAATKAASGRLADLLSRELPFWTDDRYECVRLASDREWV